MTDTDAIDLDVLTARRAAISSKWLKSAPERPRSTARGVHHLALLCSDVERTVEFYDGLLGFPLVEMFENRDYQGSTHFFFDLGNDNLLAFFDMPGLGLGPYREVLGGFHHLAISISPRRWEAARSGLEQAGVEFRVIDTVSMYFSDPDGVRLELLADPLGEMYGHDIL